MANWAVELFGKELLTKGGAKATADILGGNSFTSRRKVVLVYFSAYWCPTCRRFTPMLAEAYNGYKGVDIEVVFVSSDIDQAGFDGYFGEMPWTALPFADRAVKNQISEKFGVKGIPMLVVLSGEDGKVISMDGRGEVQATKDLAKSLALWMPGTQPAGLRSPPAESKGRWSGHLALLPALVIALVTAVWRSREQQLLLS